MVSKIPSRDNSDNGGAVFNLGQVWRSRMSVISWTTTEELQFIFVVGLHAGILRYRNQTVPIIVCVYFVLTGDNVGRVDVIEKVS
jgi:hypothetical protein